MEDLAGEPRPIWARIPVVAATGLVVALVGGAATLLWMRDEAPPPAVTVTAATDTATPARRVSDERTPTPTQPAVPSGTASPQPSAALQVSPTTLASATSTAAAKAAPPMGSPTAPGPAATSAPAATQTASPSPTGSTVPGATSAPGLAAAPYILAPGSAGIGDAFVVRVFAEGAASVSVQLNGSRYTLTPATDRFWGIVGVPVDAAPGLRTLRATAANAAGVVLGTTEVPLVLSQVQRPVDYLDATEEMTSILTDESAATELSIRASQFANFDPTRRWGGKFIRPLIGPQTTAFGQGRSINGGPVGGFHSGEDIGADAGTPVHASADGRVTSVARMPIRGLSVVIDHGAGVKSGYHHLESALVQEGAQVVQGQVVGLVGSTGFSTGPHLHWEVTVWGTNVDPIQWTRDSFEP